MRHHYDSVEPLRNLYYGILLKDMDMITTNVKSINKIISPTNEVTEAFESILLIDKEIETIL